MIDKTATEERINQGYIERLERDNAALREALQAIYSMDRDAPQGQTGPVYRDIMAVMSATARAVLRQADQD